MKEELIKFWVENKIVTDEKIIKAFREVKREDFIHNHKPEDAYLDIPLPLFEGQTISQPTTIMLMTQALEVKENDKILEVGTGSGYQAAILAEIAKKGFVYTTEIIKKLADFAEKNLKKANIKNIKVIHCDGSKGLGKYKPFDKILITASAPEVPKVLINQLKENGILVAPVGSLYGQDMIKLRKIKGKIEKESLGDFMFVPLRGKYGWK